MATPRTLADLRDIHLPSPPGEVVLDPLWLAAGVLLGGLVLAAWALRRRQLRALRQSLRELDAAERAWTADGDTAGLARTLARLLRRHASRHDPRAAALVGAEWLAFLDSRVGEGGAGGFAAGPGASLAELPYRSPGAGAPAVAELIDLVKRWLRSNP